MFVCEFGREFQFGGLHVYLIEGDDVRAVPSTVQRVLVVFDRVGANLPLDYGALLDQKVVGLKAFILNLDRILLGFR